MNLENQCTHMESPRVLTQTAHLLLANGLIWSALWSPVFFFTAIPPSAARECLNLPWGSCTVSSSAWRKSPSDGCSSHCSKEVEVRTGLRLDQHRSPASVHPLAGYGQTRFSRV